MVYARFVTRFLFAAACLLTSLLCGPDGDVRLLLAEAWSRPSLAAEHGVVRHNSLMKIRSVQLTSILRTIGASSRVSAFSPQDLDRGHRGYSIATPRPIHPFGVQRPLSPSFQTRRWAGDEKGDSGAAQRVLERTKRIVDEKKSKIMEEMKGKSASERRRSRSRDYLADIERDWRLVLHDDVLHRIDEVEEILARCVPLCPPPKNAAVTMETHTSGQATVCVSNKKLIDEYCKELQQAGLTVSVHPDDDFEPESNNKGGAADGGDAAGKVAGAGTDRRRKDGSTGEGGTP